VNSHCITDHTQGNWNGIVGDLSLRATQPVWIEDVQVYPQAATKAVVVRGNPVARQMLHSLLDYMAGPKFKPTVKLAPAEVQKLLSPEQTK
jgi:hypothetical protein